MNKKLFKIIAFCLFAICTTTVNYAQVTYAPAQELARMNDPSLLEISGVASSYNTPGAFWVHNDSGDTPRIFLVDKSGNTLMIANIASATASDWEDIASFQLNGKPYILIADIGDNGENRTNCKLYIIEEPNYDPNGTNPTSFPIFRKINFTYETGPQNCESISVNVATGKIMFVSKKNFNGARKTRYVHELPLSVSSETVTLVAKKIQEFDYIIDAPTAMDISNDGKRAIVLTVKDGAFEFTRNDGVTWADAFATAPTRVAIPVGSGNEAICYDTNGVDLYSMKEGKSSPLWFYKGTFTPPGISVSPSSANLSVGATKQLAALVTPSNDLYNWTTSDATITTVDAAGIVTGISLGTATITATTQDRTKSASSIITVAIPKNEILQAEDAVLLGAIVNTNQTGYNGTGFADFTNALNDSIEWTFVAPTSGNYDLSFRYALPTGDRPLQLKINGVVVINYLNFPGTLTWTNWQNYITTQVLNAGSNKITLTTIGSNGGNFDELVVSDYATLGINKLNSNSKKKQ